MITPHPFDICHRPTWNKAPSVDRTGRVALTACPEDSAPRTRSASPLHPGCLLHASSPFLGPRSG